MVNNECLVYVQIKLPRKPQFLDGKISIKYLKKQEINQLIREKINKLPK